MLDFVPSTPEGVNDRIPMDLSQYLLSSSPPSFALDFMALSIHNPQSNHQQSRNPSSFDNCQACQMSSNHNRNCSFHHSCPHNVNDSRLNRQKCNVLKPIIIRSECYSSDSESECSSESPTSPGKTPKKVSFADHKGLALAQVRLVKEGPDEPPQLDSILSFLTQGASAGVTSNPPIKLCFPQPASDYMAFRDKVIHNLVSLENVILDDYIVKGTIKVKNISFEKHVFVRLSLDEWSSHEDFEAVYIPGPGNCSSLDSIDTFSFSLEISPSFDVSKKIQFAVCFEENGRSHWDNNGGSNYCIQSDSYEPEPHQPPSQLEVFPRWLPEKRSDSWTEFSVWRDVGCSSRYY